MSTGLLDPLLVPPGFSALRHLSPVSLSFFFFFWFTWLCWVLAAACTLLIAACGIQFSDQGLNLGPLHWQHRVLPTGSESENGSVSPQSCWTLYDPMDHNGPPGSSMHGILQARILEWVVISSSRGASQPRDRTCVSYISCIGRRVLYQLSYWGSFQFSPCLLSYQRGNLELNNTISGLCHVQTGSLSSVSLPLNITGFCSFSQPLAREVCVPTDHLCL